MFFCNYNSTYAGGSDPDYIGLKVFFLLNGILSCLFFIALGIVDLLIWFISIKINCANIILCFIGLTYTLFMIIFLFLIGQYFAGAFNIISCTSLIIQIIFAFGLIYKIKLDSKSKSEDKK